MRKQPEIEMDDQDRPQMTVSVTDEPAEETPAAEPEPPEPSISNVPRVHDYVSLYGPGGCRLPGIVRNVRDGDPPRCEVQGFAANALATVSNVPVGRVEGDDWWCALVARFEEETPE